MRDGETSRHIHSSADDLDVRARFTLAGRFHCGVKLAERLDARRYPVTASQRLRQICITPLCQIVVGPVWVFHQRPLHEIAVVVENEDDGISTEATHISDLVRGQLVRAFASNEDRSPVGIGERYPEGGSRGPSNRPP